MNLSQKHLPNLSGLGISSIVLEHISIYRTRKKPIYIEN